MARPDSIREIGLKTYLDDHKKDHNGFGYATFITFVKSDMSITSMSKAYKVSFSTMTRWLSVYYEEAGQKV
ncbi:MAG: hypothetical protein NVS1B10_08610 [Candidatus Saccharimonadales bacterium]